MRKRGIPPNALEARRISRFSEIGCIACYLDGHPGEGYDVQHVTEGGRRLGHRWSYPLCPYQHRGVVTKPGDKLKGPRFSDQRRDFHARYGTELELVAKTDALLGYKTPDRMAA